MTSEVGGSDLFSVVGGGLARLASQDLAASEVRKRLRLFQNRLAVEVENGGKSGDSEVVLVASAMTVVTMKMVALRLLNEGVLSSLLIECSDLLSMALQVLQRNLANPQVISFVEWESVRSLLCTLLSVMDSRSTLSTDAPPTLDSPSLDRFLHMIHSLLRYCISSPHLSSELHSESFLAGFGKIISVLLEIFSAEEREPALRRDSLASLALLFPIADCSPLLSLPALATFLPGILSQLFTFASTSATVNVDLLEISIELFADLVQAALCSPLETGDDSSDVTPGLPVRRTQKWKQEMMEQIKPFVVRLLAVLSTHRDSSIRLTLLRSLGSLHASLPDLDLAEPLLDTLLLLQSDLDLKVVEESARQVASFSETTLHDFALCRLSELSLRLPITVRTRTNADSLLKQICGVLRLLGCSGVTLLAERADESLLRLFQSTAASLRIDLRRLAISSNIDSFPLMHEFLCSIPLEFGLEMRWFDELAAVLSSSHQVVQMLVDMLPRAAGSEETALLILSSLVVCHLPSGGHDHYLACLADHSCRLLEGVVIEPLEKDSVVEDLSRAHSRESCRAAAALSAIGTATAALSSPRKRKVLLVSVLYVLLEWCCSENFVVSEAAEAALSTIAKKGEQSVAELLLDHSPLIVNRVALITSRQYVDCRCTRAFSALLERIPAEGSSLFPKARLVVDDLLATLDRHNLEWSISIMRVIRSFTRAMNRWFPNVRSIELNESTFVKAGEAEAEDPEMPPLEAENSAVAATEEDEKKPPPREVVVMEGILKRTKHLLSSIHFPVRVVVMEVLCEALWFVRNFDDILLPMVHQNWAGLLQRFDDIEMLSRAAAVQVVLRMARTSHSFVYRRLMSEWWPGVERWMKQQLCRPSAHYSHSSQYKYLAALLTAMGELWREAEIRKGEAERVLSVLDGFAKSKKQPPHLRQLASSAWQEINDHINLS